MKSKTESKDWQTRTAPKSGQTQLERELSKALAESVSRLAEKYEAILGKEKELDRSA